ncbi:MAG: hypothetical protein ABMB14_23855 [Myxococcota bacterium]
MRRLTQIGFAAAVWLPPVIVVACSGEKTDDGGTAPSDEELVIESLGDAAISDTGGYIDFDVTIPDGAVSTLAYCGGWGDEALGAVWSLTDPSGAEVYTGDAPDAGKFRSDYLDDFVPGLLPESPELPPTPGSWHVQWFVGAGSDGTATCGAVHRVDTVSDPGVVHVAFVFVGVDGIDATTAPDDPQWQAALAQFEAEWGNGRLSTNYEYADFAGDVATYSVVDVADDDYSEFNDLLRTAEPAGARTITFFLVSEIVNQSAGGATILGLSGGPPGAAAVPGTSKSGVIVTLADLAGSAEDIGKIMAHEGGHFLGLFHTTEKDGGRFDVLGDTPECDPSNDANGNGQMNTDECAALGSDNVMWWTLTSGTAAMSDDQSFVLRSNPIAD